METPYKILLGLVGVTVCLLTVIFINTELEHDKNSGQVETENEPQVKTENEG